MSEYTLTDRDLGHLRETYVDSLAECDENGWEYEGEEACTSIGYVTIRRDGDVTGHGQILGNVDDGEY